MHFIQKIFILYCFASLIINKTCCVLFQKFIISTKCQGKMVYNVILLSVSLSRAIDSLSASVISILSSQLNSKPFVSLSMKELVKMWRQKKKDIKSEWERDKLISDLKWQFDLTFCQENDILMKDCINKGCREDVSQLPERGRDREGERWGGQTERESESFGHFWLDSLAHYGVWIWLHMPLEAV